MKAPRDHALGLLSKAENDLVAARATIGTGRAFDMVCFHAQQAAEKTLKALLAAKDVVYPWTHNLGDLVQIVSRHYPAVNLAEEEILRLSPYAVELRYDEGLCPDLNEALSALQTAADLFQQAGRILGVYSPDSEGPVDGR